MRIGIVQTRGMGDILIAAPIAAYWIALGHEVFWPIDAESLSAFSFALPRIRFLPVDKSATGARTAEFFVEYPKKILAESGCERVHTLYSFLTGYDFGRGKLYESVSFDSYKYIVTDVPFLEKWNLDIRRNPIREAELFGRLGLSPDEAYVVCHERGTFFRHDFSEECRRRYPGLRIVKIEPVTDNFLDWLGILDCCSAFFSVNSVYLNLVDQLGLPCEKYVKFDAPAQWTPILGRKWTYV